MKLFFSPVPHQEAIDFLKSRSAVTKDVFNTLAPELKGLAFVITGIDDAIQLQAAKNILAKLPAGTNYNDVRDELIALLPFSGAKAERRAELLLRHWGGIAYAQAQYRTLDRQRDVFPWWQYVNMNDNRVRATHVALGGIVLRHDSPFWQTHFPPWEPMCRCSIVGLMDGDVEAIREAEKGKPADEQSVLEGPLLDKLLESHTLIRGMNNVYDVRTPAEKGEAWVGWSPEDLTKGIDLAKIEKALDADVWKKLVHFWDSKWIEPGLTVRQWLTKVAKPTSPPAPAPAPPPPAPPMVLPGLGTTLWLSPNTWPKPLLKLPGNPTTLWLDPKQWPKPLLKLPGNPTTLWLNPKTWPKKPRKPRTKKAAPVPVAPAAADPAALTPLIPAPDALKPYKKLGGSTGAELQQAEDGSLWVVKRGNSASHIREEFLADQLYAAAGVRVPPAQLFETEKGPVKVAQYIEGQTLAAWQKTATPAQQAETLRQIRDAFAVDALLGNWDVAGAGNDNLLIDKDGQPWRIDNGGSLRYRAQGSLKTPQEWKPEVRDLRTMRESSVNAQTARLFTGLTDEDLARQTETRLLPARDGLLALTAQDPALRGMLEARLDWMRRNLVPYTESEIAAISAAGVRGHCQLGDEDAVEDLNALHWVEKNSSGKDVTRIRLKLTESGSAQIVATVGGEMTAPASPAGQPAAITDAYWQQLLPVLKHVGYHAASDKIYNPAKLAALTTLKPQLTALAATDPAQAKHYLDQITQIEAATLSHTPPPAGTMAAYVPPAPAAAAPAPARRGMGIQSVKYEYTPKDLTDGRAESRAGAIWTTHAYQIDRPEASISFVPWKLANGQDSPAAYALRGYVDVTVPGLPDKAALAKAQALLKELGVDTTAAPAARRELLYLQKGLRLAKPTDQGWQAIANGPEHDHEKVESLKAWISQKMGISLPAPGSPNYEPDGKTASSGKGWRVFERWDRPAESIRADLPGYALCHQTSAPNLAALVKAWMDNGGQVSNTVERLRTGISINSGMSPTMDLDTGGANYFFTRIRPPSYVQGFTRGFVFKIDALARMDAISYGGDYFGNVTPSNKAPRALDPSQWTQFSKSGGNETIFKNGLDVLDDIQAIRCNQKEAKEITKHLKAAGIINLPDGRPVSALFTP